MPEYNIYPSVDDTYSFPTQIRKAMAASDEFKSAVETHPAMERVKAYHTKSSSKPTSVINRIAGDLHFNEITNIMYVVNRAADGTLSWVEVPSIDSMIRVQAYHTRSSSIPTSFINRIPGDMHFNELSNLMYIVHRAEDGTLGWIELPSKLPDRGNAYLASTRNPNTWLTPGFNGRWDVGNTSTLNGLVTEGYTSPEMRPHYVNHYTSSTGVSYQQAFLYSPDRMYIRASATPGTPMGPWSELKNRVIESDRLTIYCSGDSLVRGGENGVDWPLEDAWPAKLNVALGAQVEVINAGKGGAFTDEVLMKSGRKRLLISATSGIIPASSGASTPVYLSWQPDTDGARWIDVPGTINNQKVIVGMHGTTGAWTVRRAVTGTAIPMVGWTEFYADSLAYENAVHIYWAGGNDSTRQIKGPHRSTPAHILASMQAYKQSLPGENHSLIIMGMYPSMPGSGNADKRLKDVAAVNEKAADLFPNEFVDVFAYLKERGMADQGLTPTAADNTLIAQGYLPQSLLADAVHPTKATAGVIATKLLYPYITSRGLVKKW